MTGWRERAKAAVAINKARMTTRVSEAKRDEESKNRLMMQKKKHNLSGLLAAVKWERVEAQEKGEGQH